MDPIDGDKKGPYGPIHIWTEDKNALGNVPDKHSLGFCFIYSLLPAYDKD